MSKAIFIDGPSLHHIGRILGIGKIRHEDLYDILVKEVGEDTSIFGKPVFVLPPEIKGFDKSLKSAGFEVVHKDSRSGEDDRYIIEEINAIKSSQIKELILVSTDVYDYSEALLAKRANGVRIYVVITEQVDPKYGRPAMSDVAKAQLNSSVTWIELAPYKDRLMLEPWIERSGEEPEQTKPRTFKFVVEGLFDPETMASTSQSISMLLDSYPALKMTMEVK